MCARSKCPRAARYAGAPPPVHWYGAIEGLLKWTVTSGDGRSVTLGGLSAGSWFGEGTLLRGTPRTADVIALRPSRVAPGMSCITPCGL